MQEMTQALDEVQHLFQKVVGQPAPDVEPYAYHAFPPGVDPVAHTLQEVDHLKKLTEQIAFAPNPAAWIPRADSFVAENEFVVSLEVPGVTREDLKVFTLGGECVVRGTRKPPETAGVMKPVTLERPWGQFERRVPLPARCHVDRVTARFSDGVLELRIPIDETAVVKETKIDIA